MISGLDERLAQLEVPQPRLAELAMPVASDRHQVGWRVSQMAREMCRGQGFNPDQHVVDTKVSPTGPFGSVSVANSVPAWTLFIEMAHQICEGNEQ